ncbi:DUF4224 domain-containing protein [Niveibacterium microcysteis]|uniref:DUF4224 domain-containing protein n=1 Tax=Niveibacterium microcysteis TaxID=2811415 RepID=A0ABX7M9W8_9RHOO|nr:DUF4224 domain-containing protein [Niveibacterium microcysteis]
MTPDHSLSHNAIFLTPDELIQLTGRKLHGKQLAALRSMRIPFLVNALGRPVVSRSIFLASQATIGSPTKTPSWSPAPQKG